MDKIYKKLDLIYMLLLTSESYRVGMVSKNDYSNYLEALAKAKLEEIERSTE